MWTRALSSATTHNFISTSTLPRIQNAKLHSARKSEATKKKNHTALDTSTFRKEKNVNQSRSMKGIGTSYTRGMHGGSIAIGLGMGYAAGKISDKIWKPKTDEEWKALSEDQKETYLDEKTALTGAVGGGLGAGLGIATAGAGGYGTAMAMAAPEVAVGASGALVGKKVSDALGGGLAGQTFESKTLYQLCIAL